MEKALEDLSMRLQAIEDSLKTVQERNRRVELDKAWETSRSRICAILLLTYLLLALVFFISGVSNYLVSAIVPTVGYFLSTQTLPLLKKIWIRRLVS